MKRPMMETLRRLAGRDSLHMPGHKGVLPFGPLDPGALDTTEIPLTDDLYAASGCIREAEALYAAAAGAARTVFLHNGSTEGVHVMLQLWAREGDTVLLPRSAHLSAVHGCVLGGLKPVWIPVRQTADDYVYVDEADVLAALQAHPEARALLLTRPDYYGGMLPLGRIAEEAHRRGIRLIVDEAHGAHLPWLDGFASAGAFGADAWTQSVHKTLPGLTGSAVLHLADAADEPATMRILRREQTSSPSFLLMLSADDARAWMETDGAPRLKRIAEAAGAFRQRLADTPYRDAHARWRQLPLVFDPTRLVIEAPQGGERLAEQLAERGFDVEMADIRRVVCILTAADRPDVPDRLLEALRGIPAGERPAQALPQPGAVPQAVMTPRRAVMAACETVPFMQCAGRIAATAAGLYPPGVPLVCPGEIIPAETAALLAGVKAARRFGTEGEGLLCVRNA